MADFLAEKRAEMETRLKELRPLHDEYLRLERAIAALQGMDIPRRRGPGRPRGSSENGRRRRGGGRRGSAGGLTRAQQALEVIRQNPGITVSQLGDKLGIAQKNYLYRVMHNLEGDGAVKKDGRGYSAA